MTNDKFLNIFKEHASNFEGGMRLESYDDGTGVPTIGVGFSLLNEAKGKWKAYNKDDLKEL